MASFEEDDHSDIEEELTVFIHKEDTDTGLVSSKEKRLINSCCNIKTLLVLFVSIILFGSFFAAGFLVGNYTTNNNKPGPVSNTDSICSNPPLLLVSLDGFRADYLTRGLTPNIKQFGSDGVHAQYMIPNFPSVTFPNHYSIVTGLHPESHGIVANAFYSTTFKDLFTVGSKTSLESKWWLGEPIWVTAVKGSLKTAIYFWPGSEIPIKGILPDTYFPYNESVPFSQRVSTVLSWFDQPDNTRPQFMALYISEPDHSGHLAGPDSLLVNQSLGVVDNTIYTLIKGLKERNIYDCVNTIIVSDHGMTTIDSNQVVTLVPELLPEEYVNDIETAVYGIMAMLYFTDSDSPHIETIYNIIKENATKLNAPIDVYLQDEVPEEYYVAHDNLDRYGDIIIIARLHSYVKLRNNQPSTLPVGEHGYNNTDPSMRALFLSHGPSFKSHYTTGPVSNTDLYELMCHLLELPPASNNGSLHNIMNILK